MLRRSMDTVEVEVESERRMMTKIQTILDNSSHPPHEYLCALSSSHSNRLLHPRCSAERLHRSFVRAAIWTLQQQLALVTLTAEDHYCLLIIIRALVTLDQSSAFLYYCSLFNSTATCGQLNCGYCGFYIQLCLLF